MSTLVERRVGSRKSLGRTKWLSVPQDLSAWQLGKLSEVCVNVGVYDHEGRMIVAAEINPSEMRLVEETLDAEDIGVIRHE